MKKTIHNRKFIHYSPFIIEILFLIYNFDFNSLLYYLAPILLILFFNDIFRNISHNYKKKICSIYEFKKTEKHISGSLFYIIGIYLNLYLGTIFEKYILFYYIGILCLTICDPIAFYVGNYIPIKIYNNGKSLGGFLSCFLSAILIHYFSIYLCIHYRNDFLNLYNITNDIYYFFIVIVGALSTAYAEFYGSYIDNLLIPVITSLSMQFISKLLI